MIVAGALWLIVAGQITPDDLQVGTLPGELVTPLSGNDNCRTCHQSATDPNLAVTSYHGTMMDLAGVDPIFLASLEIAYIDAEPAAELCIRCHFPKGWLEGRGNGAPEDYFGLIESDLIGINCDFCHRMAINTPVPGYNGTVPPPNLSGVKISNSQVFLNDGANTKYGPLGSELSVGHASVLSPLMDDSVICAQCHDVSNTFLERLELDGTGMNAPVPIERTYTEWQNSDYAAVGTPSFRSCQSCHMESYDGKAAVVGGAPDRQGLHKHELVGGNTVTAPMVAWLYSQPGRFAYFADLADDAERIVAAAEAQLQRAADLDAVELIVNAEGNYLRMRVTNKAGHKLPTGYAEGRRMWVSHEVEWADGDPGFKTGTPNYNTLDFVAGQNPIKTYEILLSEDAIQHSFHFVTVDKLLKDNRIPPAGFRPQADTAPVSVNYAQNSDGSLVHWDETDFPLGENDCWPAITTVRLYYQGTSGAYFRFLVEEAPVFGPELEAAWDAVGGCIPTVMNEVTVAVFPDGRIEEAAGPYACEAGPVYIPPEPDPVPEPEPTPDPEPTVQPDPEPTVQPDPQPDPQFALCSCQASSTEPGWAGFAAVFLLFFLRRRRAA